jgi:membrane fusion protein (multidrug efflux system)
MAKDGVVPPGDPLAKPEWAMSRRERRVAERARQGLPPPRRKWPWVLLILLIAAGALAWVERERLLALMPPREAAAEAVPEAEPPPRLTQINASEWATIEPATLRRTVRIIGTLAPVRQATVSAETGGLVEAVLVRPGDAVEEGQLLVELDIERARIDLDLARSNLASTQAQLALAEGQLERSEALVERGVAAETTLAEVRANVESLRANLAAQQDQVRAAELSVERAAVVAPFDGVVSQRSVETGGVVGAGTPLLTIVDLDRMEMLGQAPVRSGSAVRPGQRVALTVEGIARQDFEGRVSRIAPVAAEGTRTLTVYVEVENDGGPLLGGMFATGEIVLAEAEGALAVPREAVRRDAEGDFVFVVAGEVLERRGVTLGEEWPGGVVEVTEGLSPGEAVVTAPLEELEPGEAVALVEF